MTITITTGNRAVTDFLSYLNAFDDSFEPSGRGVFSKGIAGDYAASESDITDVADADAQAYVMRDNINYDMTTHTLTGTISEVDFGFGATAVDQADSTKLIDLDQLDYSLEVSPELSDADAVHDVIYGLLGSAGEGVGRTDALVDLLKTDNILFQGAGGDDNFKGYRHDDTLKGRGGDDMLKGRGGDDTLKGNAGSDTLVGGKGADTLLGGAGKDVLKGGAGDDVLNGGAGRDVLTGGGGADSFEFSGNFGKDRVTDFKPGTDTLDLSGLTGEAESFDAFLDAATQQGDKVVYDLDGDGQNVIVLLDTSLDDLSASDFLF